MFPSWMQILLVVLLIVLLFGRGKISDLMGDVAKGIKSFKKGLHEEDEGPIVEEPLVEEPVQKLADASNDGAKAKTTASSKKKAHN